MNDELYHHGILGMKWGVRRYQNEDGTLTSKGKARYMKVESSKHLQKKDTKNARKTLKYHTKMDTSYAETYGKHGYKFRNKAERYGKGTKKYNKYMKKAEENARLAEKYTRSADIAFKKLRDIDSGKLKAGRDFIVQTDFNIRLTNPGAYLDMAKSINNDYNKTTHYNGLGTYDRTIIFKDNKKK